jgi:4-hydroxybenzoate polyprenyltransferase
LDGSLLVGDSLLEGLSAMLTSRPLALLGAPFQLLGGRARFKGWVAGHALLDPAAMLYRPAVLGLLQEERARGRRLVLATGAPRRVADAVAEHLGLFERVICTDGALNRTGAAKLPALRDALGDGPFDYLGNSRADFPVWAGARRALTAGLPGHLLSRLQASHGDVVVVAPPPPRPSLALLLGALRVHQWAKNALVFIPLLAAHALSAAALFAATLAFFSFSLVASGIYLLNDLADLRHDRRHPSKSRRPFASGALPLSWAFPAIPLLLAGGFGLGLLLPREFLLTLFGYLTLTVAYSVHLKRVLALDTVVLAGLYTVRIAAGGAAVGVPISPWLFAFSMFFFLSLALVKRVAELFALAQRGESQAGGRGYRAGDIDQAAMLGSASAFTSVLVLALYINSSAVPGLYRHPQFLWLTCPILLYWLSRLWILARRGAVVEDPVVFAIKDRVSWLAFGLAGLAALLAV